MTPETQATLNALLHDAMLEQLDIDTNARSLACVLSVAATPLYPSPVNPCTLILHRLGRLRVALVTADGRMPAETLPPIELAGLDGLIRHFNHPQAGFDFIDSTREDICGGHTMLDLQVSDTVASHSLTFFWGVGSPAGSKYLLLLRFWFEQADFFGGDGRAPTLITAALADTYTKAGVPFVVAPASSSGLYPMPDVVPPFMADGETLAILFIDSARQVRAKAVGKGIWDGAQLKWLAPSGMLYEMPATNQSEIRPALLKWRQPGDLMEGFSFWTIVAVTAEDAKRGDLVRKYLKPNTQVHPRKES